MERNITGSLYHLRPMDEVEPVTVPLPPTTCRLLVRLPQHLGLVNHRVLLPDRIAENCAKVRTSCASNPLDLPVALHTR